MPTVRVSVPPSLSRTVTLTVRRPGPPERNRCVRLRPVPSTPSISLDQVTCESRIGPSSTSYAVTENATSSFGCTAVYELGDHSEIAGFEFADTQNHAV